MFISQEWFDRIILAWVSHGLQSDVSQDSSHLKSSGLEDLLPKWLTHMAASLVLAIWKTSVPVYAGPSTRLLEYLFTIWLLASCRVSDSRVQSRSSESCNPGFRNHMLPQTVQGILQISALIWCVTGLFKGTNPRKWQSLGTISEAGYHRCPSQFQFTNSLKKVAGHRGKQMSQLVQLSTS